MCPPIAAHVDVIRRLTNFKRLTLDIDLRFDPKTGHPNTTLTSPTARLPNWYGYPYWILGFFEGVRQVPAIHLNIPKKGDARVSMRPYRRNSYLFFAVWLAQRNIIWVPRQSADEWSQSYKAITEATLYDLAWLPRFE